MLLLIVSALALLLSGVAAVAEAIVEKDWPRDTLKFVIWFGATTVALLLLGVS